MTCSPAASGTGLQVMPISTMKRLLTFVLLTLFTQGIPSAFADHAVRVEVKLSTSHDDPKNSQAEVVNKQMTVVLAGSAKSGGDKLTVKARFYADDLKTDQLVVEKELQTETTLMSGRVEVPLTAVTFNFTPAHAKSTGTGRRAKSVRVPASGRRYHGWVVEVLKGSEVVGQAASHPSLVESRNQ
ncbi:hypothetical protein DES53_111118 [Roseimicrobium gellanilyticum]|uniref:Uncharacterized protein n=2 Tax=Roseimicrobium gellanilyticum TaxID=748857 RepID=A0A366H8N4_9BACT|nr:hypothetical protein DES53_111118 [Roseimicrobium gellanilyticum]